MGSELDKTVMSFSLASVHILLVYLLQEDFLQNYTLHMGQYPQPQQKCAPTRENRDFVLALIFSPYNRMG